jgi:hypothetical protein
LVHAPGPTIAAALPRPASTLSRNKAVGVEPPVPRRLTYHRAIRSGYKDKPLHLSGPSFSPVI